MPSRVTRLCACLDSFGLDGQRSMMMSQLQDDSGQLRMESTWPCCSHRSRDGSAEARVHLVVSPPILAQIVPKSFHKLDTHIESSQAHPISVWGSSSSVVERRSSLASNCPRLISVLTCFAGGIAVHLLQGFCNYPKVTCSNQVGSFFLLCRRCILMFLLVQGIWIAMEYVRVDFGKILAAQAAQRAPNLRRTSVYAKITH